MNNFIQPGDVMTFTAPNGGVTVGTPYLIGSLLVIAAISASAGDPFTGQVTGVIRGVPKATGATWSEGELLYWDNSAKKFTTLDGDEENLVAGCAAAAAGSSDTTGDVRLNGTAMPALYEES